MSIVNMNNYFKTELYPKWCKHYTFLLSTYEYSNYTDCILFFPKTFDDLKSLHLKALYEKTYNFKYYNDSKCGTLNDTFFHCFAKFVSMFENQISMEPYLQFINYLLNSNDVFADLDQGNYEDKLPYECYTGTLYTTHFIFLYDFEYDIIQQLQQNYRLLNHRRQLHKCLNIICHSPPNQVEFLNFLNFSGGIHYVDSCDHFNDLNLKSKLIIQNETHDV